DGGGRGGELGRGGQQAGRELARERGVPPRVPATVEPPAVMLSPARWRLVGRMTGACREIQQERLAGVDRAQVRQELDRVIGQVVGGGGAPGKRRRGRRR